MALPPSPALFPKSSREVPGWSARPRISLRLFATACKRSDELGFNVVERPVHVYDLQATLLHLLGFDHERLTFRHAGRDFRLTDVHGKVVKEIVA